MLPLQFVCLADGTWQSARSDVPTNVHRATEDLLYDDRQFVKYWPGPGTGWLKLLGGMFGVGVNSIVRKMYAWICAHAAQFKDEDFQLFFLAFSRGSYEVRMLADMISKLGLCDPRADMIDMAWDAYMSNDVTQMTDFARMYATRRVPVHFVGVYDTVGAHGVPGSIDNLWIPRFSDNFLSHNVLHARQALAIHERRKVFAPCVWENDDTHPDAKQFWFNGWHSDVGGGGTPALSHVSYEWMMSEAASFGLRLRDEWKTRLRPNAQAKPLPPTMRRFVRQGARATPPAARGQLSPSVQAPQGGA